MTGSTTASSKQHLSLPDDENIDETILRNLTCVLYSTPRSILVASLVGTFLAYVSARLSSDPVFISFSVAYVVIGSARSLTVFRFRRKDPEGLTKKQLQEWEFYALLGAWSFSALTGLLASYATVFHSGTDVELLTSCCAIGYIAGISSRNAGRPLITIGQISAICLPFLGSLLYQSGPVHLALAVFIAALFLSTLSMARVMHETIVSRYKATARLERAALYDTLTGLKNRTALIHDASTGLSESELQGTSVAMIVIDLDHFKDVNDGLGHLAGDAVLQETARRLQNVVPDAGSVSRIGGDEFLVMLRNVTKQETIQAAERIRDNLAAEFFYNGSLVTCAASVGFALSPQDARSYPELMASADLALYAAKAQGRGQTVGFSAKLREGFDERRELEKDMRTAIAEDGFSLAFQPIIDGRSRRAISSEALLRWEHPTRGMVSPSVFIPIAEATGAIIPLGAWVVQAACREAARWPIDIPVAVNLSAVQFKRGRELVDMIRGALLASGLPASRLEVEITESLLIENKNTTLEVINELRSDGIGVALDDFGTGFSSLAYVNDFPFTKIKLDRKFCESVCGSERTRSIIRSVAQLTADLGIDLVAEGIERRDQLECLMALGVNNFQGFIFSRPVSPSHLQEMISLPFPVRETPNKPSGARSRSAA